MAPFNVGGLVAAAQKAAAELDHYDRAGRRQQWWDERCAVLNRDRPLQQLPRRRVVRGDDTLTARHQGDVLAVPGIVHLHGCERWGHINNRERVFPDMIAALLDAHRNGTWNAWVRQWVKPSHDVDPIDACVIRGFGRDLVVSGSGGRHRMMAAAVFGFPELPATLTRTPRILIGDEVVLPAGQEQKHLEQLVRGGFIVNPSPGRHAFTVATVPAAEWSYDRPESVQLHATAFARAYPDAEIDRAMLSTDDWRAQHGTPTGLFARLGRGLRGEGFGR